MQTSRWFEARTESVPLARHWLVDQLLLSGRDHRAEDAAVCISELAANVIDHTGGDFQVAISDVGGPVRVSVTDIDPTTPHVLALDPEAERGRGLIIVQALSERWGVESNGAGKTIWFEFD